jgi:hypothetical protein
MNLAHLWSDLGNGHALLNQHMNAPTPVDSRPVLWNPNAAACWSLLLTPAFGAFLHAKNADTLGRPEEAKANRTWFYASLIYLGFILLGIFLPFIPDGIFRGAGIGLLVGWYVTLGKKQIQYVKQTSQDSYQRRTWAKPLLIGFGCSVAFFTVVLILAVIAGFLGIQ